MLPKRLEKFNLRLAPAKTRLMRFSRFHPSMTRRFAFLGFEFYWQVDRGGTPRVQRRTARKKLQAACRRITEWIKSSRHALLREFFEALNLRLLGHYRYYGVRGNSRSLYRYFEWVKLCVFKWLNRRGGKRGSLSGARFVYLLELVDLAQPRITEGRRVPVPA